MGIQTTEPGACSWRTLKPVSVTSLGLQTAGIFYAEFMNAPKDISKKFCINVPSKQ